MAIAKTKEWTGVTGGSTFGQKALLFLFHFTNVTVGYVFLALTVPFYMLFNRKAYRSIYRYFKKHHHYSWFKSFYKTYVNHLLFGECMLDRFAVYAGRRNFFNVKISGNEYFEQLLNGGKGFIIASSHVGNFELSGYLLKQDKKQINALVFGGETKEIMENRVKMFERNNISLVPVTDDMSHIFIIHEALSAGQVVSMPCDRSLGSTKSVECDFLNGKADFPLGAFSLAVHFDVPVLTVFVVKENLSDYHIYVTPLISDIASPLKKQERAAFLAKEYVKELESIVHCYPEQWFNFYDFWK